MSGKTILVWFRNDLRIEDNEILLEATRKADNVLPVYCFDPYYFKSTPIGTLKTGNIRARFILESVENLRKNLRDAGAELIVRTGNPADVLTQLAEEYHISEVYHHREVAYEETEISEQVEAALWKMRLNLKHFIGHTLYHKEDLPFPIKDIPDSFAVFKKKVERDGFVRPAVKGPPQIIVPAITNAGEMPTLADLGLQQPAVDTRCGFEFTGGETAALAQLKNYFECGSMAASGKMPKGGATVGCTSKLSPWLAMGCISPRQVYHSAAAQQGNNHPLMLELLWRDYFRFMFKKHGRQFFKAAGFKDEAPAVTGSQDDAFTNWKNGSTGVPYIDASMHELNATGYISNNSRQTVAGFLVRNLKVDWTKGATYFEEKLIDYSPASNWGNWAFVAGVGNDPRDNRYFTSIKPAEEHDPKEPYIQMWLPDILNTGSEAIAAG